MREGVTERHVPVDFEAAQHEGRWYFWLPNSPDVIIHAPSPQAFSDWITAFLSKAAHPGESVRLNSVNVTRKAGSGDA